MGTRRNRPVFSRLHPIVYASAAVLALWFVVSAWGFARDASTDYLLAIVSGFFFIAVMIPFLMWRTDVRAHQRDGGGRKDGQAFSDWAAGEFDTWQGRLSSASAAVEILLPIAAVAFGMTAFAIVISVVRPG